MFPPLVALAACSGELSALHPAGPAAAQVETLWQIMLWSAAVILGGVVGTAIYAVATSGRTRNFSTRRVLVGWGLVFPGVVLTALMGFAFLRGERLLARSEDDESALIHVHAEQWRWRFAYPGGAQSTGVLHVPAGREFTVAVTSGDVIHSFWVPRLGGKMTRCRARPTACACARTGRGSITDSARNIAGRAMPICSFRSAPMRPPTTLPRSPLLPMILPQDRYRFWSSAPRLRVV